jgi:hypothetical protein
MPAALAGFAMLALSACVDDQRRPVATSGQATCDTRFQVVNNSSATVQQLYFSHARQSGWGVDQLGAEILPPGRLKAYRAVNTGSYDFRAVWSNGRAAELRGVNICRASRIIVTDRGLIAS